MFLYAYMYAYTSYAHGDNDDDDDYGIWYMCSCKLDRFSIHIVWRHCQVR